MKRMTLEMFTTQTSVITGGQALNKPTDLLETMLWLKRTMNPKLRLKLRQKLRLKLKLRLEPKPRLRLVLKLRLKLVPKLMQRLEQRRMTRLLMLSHARLKKVKKNTLNHLLSKMLIIAMDLKSEMNLLVPLPVEKYSQLLLQPRLL
jgi:hypothetical protein